MFELEKKYEWKVEGISESALYTVDEDDDILTYVTEFYRHYETPLKVTLIATYYKVVEV